MKKSIPKLPASELQIMMVLWEGHPEMARTEIEEALAGDRHLAPTTVNSLLARLEKKGCVSVARRGKNNYYTPLISKKEYQSRESRSVLQQLFDGSLSDFVTALYDGKKIPAEKMEELGNFLQSLEEEEEKEAGS